MPPTNSTSDLRISSYAPVSAPRRILDEMPLDEASAHCVAEARSSISNILRGEDPRLLVIVGPCSIHDPDLAKAYAERLQQVNERCKDLLCIVMRTYFEKPRSTVGWKGLINDPQLDDSHDMDTGIRWARDILLHCTRLGLPTASELLDPVTPQFIADLIAWAAIGARTTESQTHREMASGLSMPVGFKNGTDGSLDIAINAMRSAEKPHAFRGLDPDGQLSLIHTTGNPDSHLVLRGSNAGPNYSLQHIQHATEHCRKHGLIERVVVDCSHGNSGKDHRQQGRVATELLQQIQHGNNAIAGLMIESNLIAGRQDWSENLTPGQSITDACIGWDETEELLDSLFQGMATTL